MTRPAPHGSPLAHRQLWPSWCRAALALGAAFGAACASGGARAGGPPAPDRAALRGTIDSLVADPKFRNAHWGILIVDPAGGDTLYSRNAGKLFMPASNQKIVTGATALALLGPDHRYRTTFAARGAIEGGVLHGDLVVIGRGDPTMSDRMRGDVMRAMRAIADSLHARGVRAITGRLVRAGDAFPDAWHGYGWGWDDFDFAYSAGVDELFLNDGFVRVTLRAWPRAKSHVGVYLRPDIGYPRVRSLVTAVRRPDSVPEGPPVTRRSAGLRPLRASMDSASGLVTVTGDIFAGDSATIDVAYRDPGLAYLHAVRRVLTERAIIVDGGVDPRPPGDTASGLLDTLFVLHSPPLREILPALEKPSQNQIAEILLKTVGLERTGVGTADSGRAAVERQLHDWGIDSSWVAVRDGSGLSRHNYITPEAIVRVLDAMRRSEHFEVFREALPVAGVDGTIRNRMRGSAAAGNVRAKTGTVDKVRSLSGYVTTADGRLLIFSVLCNNFTQPTREVDRVADAIAVRLAELRGR